MSILDSKNSHSAAEGLVFLNLGTPNSFNVRDVRKYLKQFLMDPYVIGIPYWARFFLVNGVIAPFRTSKTARAYEKIWMQEGSPLKVYSERLVNRLQSQLGDAVCVRLAMRFGDPSIAEVLREFVEAKISRISIFVAYPQYAMSSTFSALVECRRQLDQLGFKGELRFVESYEDDSGVLSGWVNEIARDVAEFKPDHILFSYHGLPESHILQISSDCLKPGCCDKYSFERKLCYRRQCYATTRGLTSALGLTADQYSVGFQSRLSKRWIKPFSDQYYRELPRRGVKKLLVVCPSFTVDCLETLEEVAIRGQDEFRRHGGAELRLVSALNDRPEFVDAIIRIYRDSQMWKTVQFGMGRSPS